MITRLHRLLAICVVTGVVAAAGALEVVYDGAYRTTALDAALDGSSLWVATSWGVTLHDVSGGTPRTTAARPLGGTTTSVAVGTSRVYVGSGRTVHVFSRGILAETLGTGQANGAISALLLIEPYLYAATSAGVEQFDLLNPDAPFRLRTLPTSTGFALRLAVSGSTLYAADGDASVEAYNIQIPSLPQGIGSFGTLARTQAVSEAGGRLYVSDGRSTDVWAGAGASLTRVDSIAGGGNSVIAVGRFLFLAGDDRRLRAYDVASSADPVKVFASASVPVGGTVNRLMRVVADGTRLHVAAGDAGLLTWDAEGFDAPFLTRGYETGTGASVASYAGGVVAAAGGSGLVRYSLSAGGELSAPVSWDAGTVSVVRDATSTSLLVSAGSRVRRFDLSTSPPSESGSVTLQAAVRSAVLRDGNAIAVLADETVWSVDFAAGAAAKVDVGDARPAWVAAGDGNLALAGFNEDGTTTIRFYAGGNLGSTPATAMVEGAASSGLSLSGSRVGCFTFRGITIVDFSGGASVRVIPGSNVGIAAGIRLSGNRFFLLTSSSLQVWDTDPGSVLRVVGLEGVAMGVAHAAGEASAVVSTSEGLVTVQFDSGTEPPVLTARVGADNRYFREAHLSNRLLHLWDGRDAASSPLDTSGLPGAWRDVRPAEAGLGVAAAGDAVYVVTPGGVVAGYSVAGARIASFEVDEGADQRILSIRSVAGALWVSVEVNCLAGGCEFRTVVLDPRNGIVRTGSLPGGAVAATVEGSTAWALFQLPDEVRALDVSNPYQPVVTAQVASTGNPVAIARDAKRAATYVLGDRLYVYTGNLTLAGQLLEPWVAEPSGRVSYPDQRVHVVDDIAVVTGRGFSPELYTIGVPTAWFPLAIPGAGAAAVRSSVLKDGRIYLLSDYSLEIWSAVGSGPPRKRPVR